ncbi:MAG: ATP-binding protein [Propionibacteriaceae bacterium]|jgi:predicted AAA+ superfamily ATPase|nr:ATP-binding protein [Propionibacteriaceae bacterium]
MERDTLKLLAAWKAKHNRKPLVLRGARQVGKTWLLNELARTEFVDALRIEFDNNQRVQMAWEPDFDPYRIVHELEILSGHKIVPGKTLLIFDEIQEFPKALTSLKYFCERAPEYHVACAGSYLGLALHEGTSFPVGKVDFIDVYPLTFTEYLRAIGSLNLLDYLKLANFERLHLLGVDYLSALKDYFYLGGMPEVVQTYIASLDFQQAREVQLALVDAYDHDFSKHAPTSQLTRVRALWNSIPEQLGKENRRFILNQAAPGARTRDYQAALQWLLGTNVAHRVDCVSEVRLPLNPYRDGKAFKLYASDVGLLGCQAGIDRETLSDGSALYTEFKGAMAEQFVLQQLLAQTPYHPVYWSNEPGKAEVDFLIQDKARVIPIEVKSGANLKAKALQTYREKYHPVRAVRFSLAQPYCGDQIIDIPLYALSLLPQLLSEI